MARALDAVFDHASAPPLPLGAGLRARYGGELALPRTWTYANFVTSVDGVVALEGPGESGHVVSQDNSGDRFVMGLLRAAADAVVIGAGTFRKTPAARWTPEAICPEHAADFAALRASLDLPAEPALVVISGRALDAGGAAVVAPTGDQPMGSVLAGVRRLGHRRVLVEGGPTVLGELVGEGLLDELFVTVSPILFGRAPGDGRKSLLEGKLAGVQLELVSLRRLESHLFCRYAVRR